MPYTSRGNGQFAKYDFGHATAAADTAVEVALTAIPNFYRRLHHIACGYSATPTGGKITVAAGASTIFELDLITAGPFDFPFPFPLEASVNQALTVTLAAGSGTVVGKVNIWYS